MSGMYIPGVSVFFPRWFVRTPLPPDYVLPVEPSDAHDLAKRRLPNASLSFWRIVFSGFFFWK